MSEEDQNAYKKRKLIATTVASPLASVIGKYLTYPIDTIKTMVQADRLEMKNISNYKVGRSLELGKPGSIQQRAFISRKVSGVSFLESLLLHSDLL